MRRVGHLFDRISDYENLREAYRRAVQGKRDRSETIRFAINLDDQLQQISAALQQGTISVGNYQQFVIHDPKMRIITAPGFAERVLHHAILNVCEPVFERTLIDDTFACRRGRGRLVALQRAREFAHRFPFYLKFDIRKYFDSIPHLELMGRLSGIFRESRLLALFERIIHGFRGELGVGLPIGSLTSQHFANCYLGTFDRYAKETLRIRGYVRYMDDMVFWGASAQALRAIAEDCRGFLSQTLRLSFKAEPEINRTVHGVDFLGSRLFPTHLELNHRSRIRFRRQLSLLEAAWNEGQISDRELQQRTTSLLAFTTAGGIASWRWRTRVISSLAVSGHQARTG